MREPATQLYLLLPPIADAAQFKPVLAAALGAADVACVLLRDSARTDVKAIAQALMPLAQERDVAFLIEGDPRLAARIRADGVHVAYAPEAIENAMSSLGADAIVGAGALATRDDAMSAGETGASYVMFGEPDAHGTRAAAEHTLERVAWWAEIFNVPCVGYAGTLDEIGPLAEAGADFVALGDAVWQHSGGPADAINQANAILANAILTA
ncbi:MAG: thiamine-phosphate pyrophosphorylase [Methylobacteriaceae bacterium]|nr:thiamine-phosphate pyrophosphorylase [Methylobacteriaceae bacterium]